MAAAIFSGSASAEDAAARMASRAAASGSALNEASGDISIFIAIVCAIVIYGRNRARGAHIAHRAHRAAHQNPVYGAPPDNAAAPVLVDDGYLQVEESEAARPKKPLKRVESMC